MNTPNVIDRTVIILGPLTKKQSRAGPYMILNHYTLSLGQKIPGPPDKMVWFHLTWMLMFRSDILQMVLVRATCKYYILLNGSGIYGGQEKGMNSTQLELMFRQSNSC